MWERGDELHVEDGVGQHGHDVVHDGEEEQEFPGGGVAGGTDSVNRSEVHLS